MRYSPFLDELAKLGAIPEISDDEAFRAYKDYVKAKDSDITPEQAGRWALVGGAAGLGSSAVGSIIKGSPILSPETRTQRVLDTATGLMADRKVPIPFGRFRAGAAAMATGGVMGALTPWARNWLDQQARLKTLNQYMAQAHDTAPDVSDPAYQTKMGSALLKLSAGIHVYTDPTLLPQAGMVGKYLKEDAVRSNPWLAEQVGLPQGKDLLAIAPLEQVQKHFPNNPEMGAAVHRATKRHELTHWLRERQGKMQGYGEPGLRNVVRTAREEAIANLRGAEPILRNPALRQNLKPAELPNAIMGSVHAAYPQGVGRAAFSGTLKPFFGLAQKIGLVK